MLIKTLEFKQAANKILLAYGSDKQAANLELVVNGQNLYLNVTNTEFYVSVAFPIEQTITFRAVVDAVAFLDLISNITTEEFDLQVDDRALNIKAGKSKYKLPLIYENNTLMTLPVISITNKTVEMNISNDILMSILNVNSKELQKAKGRTDLSELQRLYYIDETGCFTFTTGACLNAFTLEKPIKLLLNERIVKLFKLFSDDVIFTLGYDPIKNSARLQTKISLYGNGVYVAAILMIDDLLLTKVQGPCEAMKALIKDIYDYNLVLATNDLNSAITRLLSFNKHTAVNKENPYYIEANILISGNEFQISDINGNTETVTIENGSFVKEDYKIRVNLLDIKYVLDSCKIDRISLNCGNGRAIIVNRGTISNVIKDYSPSMAETEE